MSDKTKHLPHAKLIKCGDYAEAQAEFGKAQKHGFVVRGPFTIPDPAQKYAWAIETIPVSVWVEVFHGVKLT